MDSTKSMFRFFPQVFLAFSFLSLFVRANAKEIRFNRDVRSILSENCFQCHGPDSKARKSKLRLDEKDSATANRSGVRAVVPGKPNASELISRIFSNDLEEIMPPPKTKRILSSMQKDILRQWIAEGAKFETHWSYQKPIRPELPPVKGADWAQNEVDHFVLSKLNAVGLKPSEETDRFALVRRITLDLTGLPPTPEEADAFVLDKSAEAYENLVDRLLGSKAYGEHWARHWLDLARYADSAGYADDQPRTIWGFRDWVIRAYNSNMPFDQFTIEQLAGDLLPEPTADQLVATAFHRNTQTNNEGGTNDEEFRNVAIVDRVNTTMATWMGTTIGCAQCHDHKYDPITQEEYFRFFAIFNNTQDADRRDESPTVKAFSADQKQEKERLKVKLAGLEKKLAQMKARGFEGWEEWANAFSAPLLKTEIEVGKRTSDGLSFPVPDGSFSGILLDDAKSISIRIHPKGATTGKKGRFVRVTNLAEGAFLHLAEVQVLKGKENLALKGIAKQVSTGFGGPAKYANDGNVDGNYAKKSVSHTGQSDNPWWEVDLGGEFPVEKVVVWNRTDAGTAARLKKFLVELLDSKRTKIWAKEVSKVPSPSHSLKLDGFETLATIPFPRPNGSGAFRFSRILANKTGWNLQVSGLKKQPPGIFLLDEPLPKLETPLPKDLFAILSLPKTGRSPDHLQKLRSHFAVGRPEVKRLEKDVTDLTASIRQMKPLTTVPILRELTAGKRRKTHIQIRGDFLAKDKEVTEGVPAVFHPLPKKVKPNRLGVAQWIVSEKNPLTARVVANRYWEALFGQGIVRTSEEFGSQGELPSHPELLDWLSTELVRVDWDIKAFLKTLVLSATYRQSSKVDSARLEKDPFNQFMSRGPRQRLSAEMIRDHALAVSGLLSRKMYGPPVKPPQPSMGLSAAFGPGLDWKTSPGEDKFRRGIYVHWRRTNPYPSMTAFDAPNRFVCNVRRTSTNTPLQALVTLNDPVYFEAAQALARLINDSGQTKIEKIERGFQLCLTRLPSHSEIQILLALYEKAHAFYAGDLVAAKAITTEPIGSLPQGVDPVELAAWTVLGNMLLNLDEIFLKR